LDTLYENVQRAQKLINDDPAKAASILSRESGGEESAENFWKWMTHPYVSYGNVPGRFEKYASFMKEIGLIDKTPGSWEDFVFDNPKNAKGS
jgi:NitT/TauT family transport system substrate-binding protein